MSIAWLLDSRLLAAAGWSALHFAWQGMLIAACVWLLVRTRLAPRHIYAAAMLALCASAVLVVVSFVQLGRAPIAPSVDATAARVAPALLELPGIDRANALAVVLGWFVLAIALVRATRVIGGYLRATRTHGGEPGAGLAAEYSAACASSGLRRAPALRVVEGEGPAVVGCVKPMIVVPASLFDALSPTDRVAILAHELAHVRRRDPLAKALQSALLSLLGIHPCMAWLGRLADREREKCCDDDAARSIGDARAVARALARSALASRRAPLVPALSASGGSLLQRIERLAAPANATASRTRRAPLTLAAALLALAPMLSIAALRDTTQLLPVSGVWNERVVFQANDPAGSFTIAVDAGRATAVTLDGVDVPAARVQQIGQWISIRDGAHAPLRVRLLPPQAIAWSARDARSPSDPSSL